RPQRSHEVWVFSMTLCARFWDKENKRETRRVLEYRYQVTMKRDNESFYPVLMDKVFIKPGSTLFQTQTAIAHIKGIDYSNVTHEDLACCLESVNHRQEWVKRSTQDANKTINTNSTEGGHSHVRQLLSRFVLLKGVTDPTSIAMAMAFVQWYRNATLGFRIGEHDDETVTMLTRFRDTRQLKKYDDDTERKLFCGSARCTVSSPRYSDTPTPMVSQHI
ncbi:MAG: hypothetical protein MHM6MM_004505, partial [Cercozoa sp. M6MM]